MLRTVCVTSRRRSSTPNRSPTQKRPGHARPRAAKALAAVRFYRKKSDATAAFFKKPRNIESYSTPFISVRVVRRFPESGVCAPIDTHVPIRWLSRSGRHSEIRRGRRPTMPLRGTPAMRRGRSPHGRFSICGERIVLLGSARQDRCDSFPMAELVGVVSLSTGGWGIDGRDVRRRRTFLRPWKNSPPTAFAAIAVRKPRRGAAAPLLCLDVSAFECLGEIGPSESKEFL